MGTGRHPSTVSYLPAVKDSGFKTSKSESADHDKAADILESCTGPIPIISNKTTENAIFFLSFLATRKPAFFLSQAIPYPFRRLLRRLPNCYPYKQYTLMQMYTAHSRVSQFIT